MFSLIQYEGIMLPEIGLGSLVVQTSGDGPVMVVAAAAGDEMFCVSRDLSIPLRLWCHRAILKKVEQRQAA